MAPPTTALRLTTALLTTTNYSYRHGEAVGVATDYTVLSEAAQLQLVRACLAQVYQSGEVTHRLPEAGTADPRAVLRTMLNAEATAAKAAIVTAVGNVPRPQSRRQAYDMIVEGEGGELRALAAAVAPLYDTSCRDAVTGLRTKVDFESMLRLGLRLLKESGHGASYAEMYEHVLVDEFQDTSAMQCELVCLLAAHHRNLFVVGDMDQGIYSWRQVTLTSSHSLVTHQ